MSRPISNIAVCVGTFGDKAVWEPLAERAMASVDAQSVRPVWCTWSHNRTLQDARNSAALGPIPPGDGAEWLCFLDADDELAPGYIEAMAAVVDGLQGDWLLQPATIGVYPDGSEDPAPIVIPPKFLPDGNFMVISTLIRGDQFHRLGGFSEWPIYEDWDLWLRAWRDGAQLRAVPEAVLRVHVNPNGRNGGDRATHVRYYHEIRNQYL